MTLQRAIARFLVACMILLLPVAGTAASLPEGFVYCDEYIPDAVLDLRSFTSENFVGMPIDGYVTPRCIMTREAARALQKVQDDLKRFSLGLKIYDAYRPQRAVDHFVRWAKDLNDTRMKSRYYPNVDKQNLFKEDYIADRSGHSRGSTVDLTIVFTDGQGSVQELDMGTGFDLFDPRSWPDASGMTAEQRAHRMLLQVVMEKHGFVRYPQEWWHFRLAKEPFPETYFDFPID